MNSKLELATGEKGALDTSAERAIKPLKQMFIDTEDGINRQLLEENLRAIAKPAYKIYCGQLLERIKSYRNDMVNKSQSLSARVAYAKQLERKMFEENEIGNLQGFRETDVNRILEMGAGTELSDELVVKMIEVRATAFEELYFNSLKEVALRSFAPKGSSPTKQLDSPTSVPKPAETLQQSSSAAGNNAQAN